MRTRGLFLWSVGVSFTHPVKGEEKEFEVGLPEIFGNTMNMERRKTERGLVEEAVEEQEGREDEVMEEEGEMD
jgi:hypothetical protein